ncbi:RagB/SusD family nutrient uptake outer membrane protein [Sunxiuqinia indica]|uniref:RagB/SusD family nutrient uptake outer membrane protein n=1 Tax=Sunxiuqinia indica TaxID=2692584 RepID=UPI00135CDDFE|nr:RagB/SusD family nutrient uptake outer membrane protein [Sunxiuqinia indica]
MKNILYIGISVLLLFIVSCNESFLETTATDNYNESNWWQTESQAVSSINGCYAVLREDQLYGNNALMEENISPNSFNQSGDILLATGAHTAGNETVFRDRWNANYKGIGRVNILLDNIERVQMDDALKTRIKGEASFLRGLFYFNLANYFGGVPLILESPDFEKQANLPRNTRQEVIDQVLADLDYAASVLPVSYVGSDIGRATKGAALALKARVLLYESRWSEAALAAKAVMELKYYGLFSDYRGLFQVENEGNKEVIFDVQYKVPEYTTIFDIQIELQLNVAPTLDLVNSYLMSDGLTTEESPLFDPAHPYDNRDPRLQKAVVIPGYMFRGGIASPTKYFSTGFGFKKYTSYKDDVVQANINNSELNFIVLRYADILLMYAEATNEVAGSDPSVYDALNQIRSRALMPDITPGLTKDQMREVIRHERRIELAGEALYYNDIRRWHTAEVVMNANVLNSKGEVVQVRSFNPERDYLWPIQEITRQENPALDQNPKY